MLTIQKFLAPAIDRLLPRAKIVDAVNPLLHNCIIILMNVGLIIAMKQ